MSLHTIEQDEASGLSLLQDGSDPPRYYVQRRNRRELIAIGDETLARTRFTGWKERHFAQADSTPRWSLVNAPSTGLVGAASDIGSEAILAT